MSPFPDQGLQPAADGPSAPQQEAIPDSAQPTNSKPVKHGVGVGMKGWDESRQDLAGEA